MPPQPVVRPDGRLSSPSPWRGAGEQMPTCSLGREEPTPEQGDTPQDGRDSMGKPTLEQSVPEGLQPAERTHTGAVHEELQHVGRTHVEEFC